MCKAMEDMRNEERNEERIGTLVTGTVKGMLQYYYENITHDFRCDSLTLTPCIC